MQNKLTAPSAKELYFKAILLYLANDDAIGANQAMQKYLNNDPTFLQTRQQKFAQALITSVKEQNLSLFSNEWYIFDNTVTNSTKLFLSTSGKPLFWPRSNPWFPKKVPLLPLQRLFKARTKSNCDRIVLTSHTHYQLWAIVFISLFPQNYLSMAQLR